MRILMVKAYITRMRRLAIAALVLLVAGCATTPRPAIDLANADLVDLTYPFDERTLYWPSSPSTFQMKELAHGMTPGGYFYASNSFCAPEHGGTHLDAPIHFAENGVTADAIPLQQLIGPAIVIDVAQKAAANADYRLTADDVRAWEARNGAIAPGTIVLLRTGWGARYPNRKQYFGDDTPSATKNLHFPSYGEDAARLLVGERHVGALGIDTASIDYGQSSDFIVHRVAMAQNVPGFENVANLENLPERGATVIALPMKIGGGSGGPLRIVALVPR
jgi:kynurenine formamidase